MIAGRISRTSFHETLQCFGYNYNDHTIALRQDLRFKAVSTIMTELMHIFCVYGIVRRQLEATMCRITHEGRASPMVTPSTLDAYLKNWRWPSQFKNKSARVSSRLVHFKRTHRQHCLACQRLRIFLRGNSADRSLRRRNPSFPCVRVCCRGFGCVEKGRRVRRLAAQAGSRPKTFRRLASSLLRRGPMGFQVPYEFPPARHGKNTWTFVGLLDP